MSKCIKWEQLIENCNNDSYNDKIMMIDGAILLSKLSSIDLDVQESILSPLNDMVQRIKIKAQEIQLSTSYEHEKLFDIVSQEIYENSAFRGDTVNYYQLSNCFVHSMIQKKTGIPITLCAIYQYVFYHSFNIMLQPMGAPGHFLLKWESGGKYIDAFDGGNIISQSLCVETVAQYLPSDVFDDQRIVETFLSKATPNIQIFSRMLANIIGYSSRHGELVDSDIIPFIHISILLDPNNYLHRILRIEKALNHPEMLQIAINDQNYLRTNMDDVGRFYSTDMIDRLLNKVQIIAERTQFDIENEPSKPPATNRNDQILFSVGQLVHHKKFGYRGVIFGYDPQCTMSDEWVEQMNVSAKQRSCPFYHVLVHVQDRPTQTTYVCADNIEILETEEIIENEDLGRYFEQFDKCNSKYIPNQLIKYMYPACG